MGRQRQTIHRLSSRRALILAVAGVVLLISPSLALGDEPVPTQKRVLLLYHYGRESPGAVLFDRGFENAIKSVSTSKIELYREYLESYRFPGEEHAQLMRNYLKEKYAGRKIDLIAIHTDTALDFLLRFRDELFPGVPLVYAVSKRPQPGNEPALSTGIWAGPNIEDTLEIALQLQPETRNVFVVSGTSNNNAVELEAQAQLKRFESRVRLTYLFGRSLDELISTVRSLPEHSIILYQRQTQGAGGRGLLPRESVVAITQAANSPVYSTYDVWIGEGIVGGKVVSNEDVGTRVARLGLRVLQGTRPEDIAVESVDMVPMFDSRQLRRWGISEERLPAGSIVLFRQSSFWELYRWRIVGVLALVLLEALLIVALLIQRSRRAKAEESRRLSQAALQNMSGRLISLRDEEQRRIAAELHDGLGQSLVIINNRALIGLRDAADSSRATEQFEEISSAASSAIDEVREIAYNLRPHELGKLGLAQAIKSMVSNISGSSPIRLSTDLDELDGLLSEDAETGIYRIVQEALNNVVRHSEATEAHVTLKRSGSDLAISIADNGKGISQPANGERTGLGLVGIAERARMLGGSCVVDSDLKRGTTVTLKLSMHHNEKP